MKKLLSVLLALCLVASVLALVSCKKEKTTAEKLTEAVQATQAYDAYAALYDMKISMDMDGVSMDIPMTMDMKIKGATTDSPIASMNVKMEMLGMELEMPMYMEGEWIYASVMGMNYKMRADENETEAAYAESVSDMLQILPEDVLEGVEMTLGEDGSETVSVPLSDEKFMELFGDVASSAANSASGADSDVSLADATVSITVKDGLVSVYGISFTMNMQMDIGEGQPTDVAAGVTATVTFTEFGDTVVITPPEGYENYQELDQ